MSGLCSNCGRVLRNPASILVGFGPVCYQKLQGLSDECDLKGHRFYLPDDPLLNGLICKRIGSDLYVNIPHRLIKHSPTGFECAYSGSGPADLALNTLLCFTDKASALRMHQAFKFKFIATMPPRGGHISAAEIMSWIAQNDKIDLFSLQGIEENGTV